jgi:hypothetical protein
MTSNIEAVARHICEDQLGQFKNGSALAADVDRYWHCVAAQLEAGLIDETGNELGSPELGSGLAAYRDWRQRHPI